MKKVYLLKLSTEEEKTEMIINQFIEGVSRNAVINWLTNLIRPLDSNKFMLVGEVEGASEEPTTPGIGVKVVRGSQNMKETEKILNSALMELEMDEEEPKSFLSIFNPIENMYIILFEYKAIEDHTMLYIRPNPADPVMGSRYLTKELEDISELDPECVPYDTVMTFNQENIIFLYYNDNIAP